MAMLPQEIIRRKRDGKRLTDGEIAEFVRGITDDSVSEGQVGAFAMAVYFRGLDSAERVALTRAMTASGTMISWDLPGPVVDKHSTGGVGDTASLMIAPMVASCGAFVPMISGRGLGHTGGTFDKMEAIPGYVAAPSMSKFRSVVSRVGCAIIGQTADLAPADRRLYGVRDVTATVESIGLITASILSKKLAAGLDALAMDVKVGNGAFLTKAPEARRLASSIVTVASGAGVPTTALLTAMDRPLADTAGNALEVVYAIDYLTGARREPRMHELVLALGAEMLVLGKLARDTSAARVKLQRALDNGDAAERFQRMVVALGGPKNLLTSPWKHLARAPVVQEVAPSRAGVVSRIDTRQVGLAVVALGGGRTRPGDPIDHAVGLTALATIGDKVGAGHPLAVVHARDEAAANRAAEVVRAAYRVGGRATARDDVVLGRVTVADAHARDR
jgi:thymidine phosphorylase